MEDAMTQHTPGPQLAASFPVPHEMHGTLTSPRGNRQFASPCGCTVEILPAQTSKAWLHTCPTHTTATEMLALLRALRTAAAHKTTQELGREFYCWCDAPSLDDLHESEHAPICQTARALLARIEGKE